MIRNAGTIDRALRTALGLALIAGALVGQYVWLGILGGVFLATGLSGFCPIYRVFRLGTRSNP